VSPRATEPHFHVSQGEVAHDIQAHSNRVHLGVHGKSGTTGSAGFAQVLGEQVVKSSPKVKAVEQFAAPAASHVADVEATAQPLAGLHLGRSEGHDTSHVAQPARPKMSEPKVDGESAKTWATSSRQTTTAARSGFAPDASGSAVPNTRGIQGSGDTATEQRTSTDRPLGEREAWSLPRVSPAAHDPESTRSTTRSLSPRAASKHDGTTQVPSQDRSLATDTSEAGKSPAEPSRAVTESSQPKLDVGLAAVEAHAVSVELPEVSPRGLPELRQAVRTASKHAVAPTPQTKTMTEETPVAFTAQASAPVAIKVAATSSDAIEMQASATHDDSSQFQAQVPARQHSPAVKRPRSDSPASLHTATDHSSAAAPTFEVRASTVTVHTAEVHAASVSAQPVPGHENSQSGLPATEPGRAVESRTSLAAAATRLAPPATIPASGPPVDRAASPAEERASTDQARLKPSEGAVNTTSSAKPAAATVSKSAVQPPVATSQGDGSPTLPSLPTATPVDIAGHRASTVPSAGKRPSHVEAHSHQAQFIAQPSTTSAAEPTDGQSHAEQMAPTEVPRAFSSEVASASKAPPAQTNASSPWRKSDRAVQGGFGPDTSGSEAPNSRAPQASGDTADGPESARTPAERPSPRSSRLATPAAELPAATVKPSAPDQHPAQVEPPAGGNAELESTHKAPGVRASSQALPATQVFSPPLSQPDQVRIAEIPVAAAAVQNSKSTSIPEASQPTPAKTSVGKAPSLRLALDPTNQDQETKSAKSNADLQTPANNAGRPVASQDTTARGTTDKPTTVAAKQTSASPVSAPSRPANRTSVQAETEANKTRAHLGDDEEPAETSAAPSTTPQTSSLPAHSLSAVSTETKPAKSEVSPPSDARKSAESSSQASLVQPAPAQPQIARAEVHPAVLPTTDRPALFAPQAAFLPANGEGPLAQASASPAMAAQRAELFDRAVGDPGLSINVMPHSAHLSIAGDAGDLALHVRVRDGSADVNVSGTMAPLFDAKAPEVRTVLAGEGLQLGSFATDQRGHSQSQQGQPDSAPKTGDLPPLPQPRRASPSTPEVRSVDDRRIHVTA
jgi:hypothetical protein